MSGGVEPSPHGTFSLLVFTPARADWRALTSAVLIGSGIGLGLGAAYLMGGMARAATDHARASRLAEAASGGYSESILQHEAAAMDPGVLHVLRAHDPNFVASFNAGDRDHQVALLTARLERRAIAPAPSAIVLRAAFGGPYNPAAQPFHMSGALETSRELECLTQAVYFEARGEVQAGQAAVAQVVLNRVRNPAYPKTVCGVVFQGAAHGEGCQFSFACDGSMRRGREFAAWTRAQEVASRALSGGVMAAVGNATHFHTTSVAPTWGPSLLRVAQVGLHVFYRLGHGVSPVRYAADGPETNPEPEIRLASAVVEAPTAPSTPAGALQAAAESVATPAEPKASAKGSESAKPAAAKLTPTSQPRTEPVKTAVITAS
jgi:spore germination cell wall hydrolase CwlJ-like protein